MSVEAKDVKSLEVLKDVKFLADAVQTIRFYTSPDSWIKGYMPQIDTWSQGQMSVLIKPENVNKVAADLPNVHSSLFSRGVKNFKEIVRSLEQRCKDQQQEKVM